MILEGSMDGITGVIVPVTSQIYLPILKELEQLGISCLEKTEIL